MTPSLARHLPSSESLFGAGIPFKAFARLWKVAEQFLYRGFCMGCQVLRPEELGKRVSLLQLPQITRMDS